MVNRTQAEISCPHCGHPVTVVIVAEVETIRAQNTTQVSIDDLEPVRCPTCEGYVQAKISDLSVGYDVVPLDTN